MPMPETRILLTAAATLLSVVCQTPISAAHASPALAEFAFAPPSSSPKFPDMVIGILKPHRSGSLFAKPSENTIALGPAPLRERARMLSAAESDLARMIIAKGYRCAGVNLTRDKLAETRKEQITMLLDPEFHLDLAPSTGGGSAAPPDALITGDVTLLFTEPGTGARIWRKRIEFRPFATNPGAKTDILGEFYPVMMRQIWDQLNPVDFRVIAIKLVPD